MKWFKASMVLAIMGCCWGVHLIVTGDTPAKPRAGLYLFIGGFGWAVVIRLVSSIVTPRVIVEKDRRRGN